SPAISSPSSASGRILARTRCDSPARCAAPSASSIRPPVGWSVSTETGSVADDRDEREDAILDAAIELAASGGFDHVRQRDVAARANVALGTLYKRFRSKEDLLAAVWPREVERLAAKLAKRPAEGATIPERVGAFFAIATQHLCRRPRVAHATMRAVASGVPEIASKVTAYQGRMAGLLITAMGS